LSNGYEKEKYLEMLLDSAEAILSIFSFSRFLYGFDNKKTHHWWEELYQQRERAIGTARTEMEVWRGFIEKLPTDEDKVVITKMLDSCYKYSLPTNEHSQECPFPSET
jgi:hypothetical protein